MVVFLSCFGGAHIDLLFNLSYISCLELRFLGCMNHPRG